MALTVIEADEALAEFLASYPSAAALTYSAGRREADTFGIAETETQIKGMYYSAQHPGERSAVRIALDHANSKADLIETLRHEVLGHWAIDTFTPEQKAAILYGLVLARNQPGLRTFWDSVDHDYAKLNLGHMGRAEEVWARIAETIEPGNRNDLRSASDSFRETCVERSRLMTLRDVINIVDAVAGQIRDGRLRQQTFRTGGVAGNRFSLGAGHQSFREQVATEMIEALKRGSAPWQRVWDPVTAESHGLPINPATGKRYHGINALHLMLQGHEDSRWMTYRQATSIGATVREGEKATRIEYWQFEENRARIDARGMPVMGDDGRPLMERTKLERPKLFTAHVFNAEQIDGMPAAISTPRWDNSERAEAILERSGARIVHRAGVLAHYRADRDEICVPAPEDFSDVNDYYSVAIHALAHWTGNASRLDRDLSHPVGSEGYAAEALRTEIASMMMGRELGLKERASRDAGHVSRWIKILTDDPDELFRAAAAAEKIFDYVMAFSRVQRVNEPALVSMSRRTSGGEGRAMQERVYAEIPQEYEAEATALGGTYDADAKLWWFDGKAVPSTVYDQWPVRVGIDNTGQPVLQKLPALGANSVEVATGTGQPIYISVPYAEKDAARELGARWDRAAGSWYIPAGVDAAAFTRWPQKSMASEASPEQEFAEFLRGLGFTLEKAPVMDGRPHRAETIGDRDGARSGSYVGYLDGHPAGYAKNHRTGDEARWKSTHQALGSDGRGIFLADAMQRRASQNKERETKYEKTATWMAKRATELLTETAAKTPYVQSKGVRVAGPLLADETGETLYVPGFDVDGKLWTMQKITADGGKEFAPGSKKTGCFFPLNSLEELARVPVIVIAEGVATAATVHEVTQPMGYGCVAAFDAGNLLPVAEALRGKFPETAIVIAGDDDRSGVLTLGRNVGREKAEAAAAAVGGKAVFPVFARSENEYPSGLTQVTQASYKAHTLAEKTLRERTELSSDERADLQGRLLSTEQLDALARMKRYTDWNDLAHHGRGGLAAVQRQLTAALKPVVALTRVADQVEHIAPLKARPSESAAETRVAGQSQTRRL